MDRNTKGLLVGLALLFAGTAALSAVGVPFGLAALAFAPLATVVVLWGRLPKSNLFDAEAYTSGTTRRERVGHWAVATVADYVVAFVVGFAAVTFLGNGSWEANTTTTVALALGVLLGGFAARFVHTLLNGEYGRTNAEPAAE